MNLDHVLRSVLDEAAETTPTPHSSGVPDALRRAAVLRRRRTAARAGGVGLVAAAVVGVSVVPRLLTSAPTVPAHQPTPAPPASVVTPEPGRTTAAGTRAGFGTITFAVPAGWKVRSLASTGDSASKQICIHPDPEPQEGRVFGCAGVEIDSGHLYSAGADSGPWPAHRYRPHQPYAWYPSSEALVCPVNGPAAAEPDYVRSPRPQPIEQGFRRVGSRSAYYDRWAAECVSGHRFTPQAWYLPASKLLIKDYTGHPETASILASVRFAS